VGALLAQDAASGAKTLLYEVVVDRGIDWDAAQHMLHEALTADGGASADAGNAQGLSDVCISERAASGADPSGAAAVSSGFYRCARRQGWCFLGGAGAGECAARVWSRAARGVAHRRRCECESAARAPALEWRTRRLSPCRAGLAGRATHVVLKRGLPPCLHKVALAPSWQASKSRLRIPVSLLIQ
jgi:hypothetical protein